MASELPSISDSLQEIFHDGDKNNKASSKYIIQEHIIILLWLQIQSSR